MLLAVEVFKTGGTKIAMPFQGKKKDVDDEEELFGIRKLFDSSLNHFENRIN